MATATSTTRKASKTSTKVTPTEAPAKAKITQVSGDKTVPPVATKKCLCGCNGNVPSKSNYKMGHDARHAGIVGRETATLKMDGDKDWKKHLNNLPTGPLQTKALNIALKAEERTIAKLEAEEKKADAKEKAAKKTAKSTK